MNERREIIVMQQTEATSTKYAVDLPEYSFPTSVCSTLHGFKRLHSGRRVLAGVMIGNARQVRPVIHLLKRMDDAMWLVYVDTGTSMQERIALLGAGVDVCLPGDIASPELAATLAALARRMRRGTRVLDNGDVGHMRGAPRALSVQRRVTVPAQAIGPQAGFWGMSPQDDGHRCGQWHITDGGRTLCGPTGQRLALTPSERIFMARMLHAAGRPVHRQAITPVPEAIRDYATTYRGTQAQQDGRHASQDARSVDVLVSRLRRKAANQGMNLPIMAVRGWGYTFAPTGEQD